MKIISGQYGGLMIQSSAKSTHPMSEKMRGALFNSLGELSDLKVLDAFSGSGALGLESISRGARNVVAVESNKKAQFDIKSNIKRLGLSAGFKLYGAKIDSWSNDNPDEKFDLILCDPPYDDLQLSMIEQLADHLNEGGFMILSWPPKQSIPELLHLAFQRQKNYGDSSLIFYKSKH